MRVTRRDFVAASALALACRQSRNSSAAAPLLDATGPLLLFQGDSITDCGREPGADENSSASLGFGYPLLVAAALSRSGASGGFRFANRGVSGNRSSDLAHRWRADTLALRPSLVSVLIGVNDFAHRRAGFYHGTAEDLERACDQILAGTRAELPDTRLIVIEPFLIRSGAVDASWLAEFAAYRTAVRRAAARSNATFVELQEAFDSLSGQAPAERWSRDGIHPTLAGHAVIADRWQMAASL